MEIATRTVEYGHGDVTLQGVVACEADAGESRPGVLVVHGIEGPGEMQVDFARMLAEQGYAAFAVDLFGTSAAADDAPRCEQLMAEFLQDRAALHERLFRVLEVARTLPEVDPTRVGAVGFCFGGLCVLDLARAGADLRGVASFHGLLTPPDTAGRSTISSRVIVFHGWDDPFAHPEDVVALGRELSDAGADWQVCAYGGAMHAFMAPTANSPQAGVAYDAVTARRAWDTMTTFLAEALS